MINELRKSRNEKNEFTQMESGNYLLVIGTVFIFHLNFDLCNVNLKFYDGYLVYFRKMGSSCIGISDLPRET